MFSHPFPPPTWPPSPTTTRETTSIDFDYPISARQPIAKFFFHENAHQNDLIPLACSIYLSTYNDFFLRVAEKIYFFLQPIPDSIIQLV